MLRQFAFLLLALISAAILVIAAALGVAGTHFIWLFVQPCAGCSDYFLQGLALLYGSLGCLFGAGFLLLGAFSLLLWMRHHREE